MEPSWQHSSNNPPVRQEGEEASLKMNVCLRIIKTVNFKITKNDTVGRLKALVSGMEGIPECYQEIFFNGNHLENDTRLVDYGIRTNSTLNAYVGNFVPIWFYIKLPYTMRTLRVEMRAQNTIRHVKALIEGKEKISSDQFSLVYGGKVLEEDKTLAFFGITGASTLHMVFNPKEKLQISVKMLTGETVKTKVRILSTVLEVKTMAESKVGYPVKALAYEGKKLDDSKTLLHYDVEEGSVLEMLPPPNNIFIKFRGKSTGFEFHLEDSVRSLKENVFTKLGVPVDVQKLIFEGKVLNDDCKDLASYKVENDCNIFLQLSCPTLIENGAG